MQITIALNTNDSADLGALAALVDALNGRTGHTMPKAGSSVRDDRYDAALASGQIAEQLDNEQTLRSAETGRPTQSSDGGEASAPSDAPAADSAGLPWDERIHSNPPSMTQDGKWRKRRGVSDETVQAVTAELTGGSAEAGVPDAPLPPADATPSPATPDVPLPPADTASGTGGATSAANTADQGDAARFNSFGAFVSAVQSDKPGAVYKALNDHAATLGATDFKSLKDRPELWDLFYDSFEGA